MGVARDTLTVDEYYITLVGVKGTLVASIGLCPNIFSQPACVRRDKRLDTKTAKCKNAKRWCTSGGAAEKAD